SGSPAPRGGRDESSLVPPGFGRWGRRFRSFAARVAVTRARLMRVDLGRVGVGLAESEIAARIGGQPLVIAADPREILIGHLFQVEQRVVGALSDANQF